MLRTSLLLDKDDHFLQLKNLLHIFVQFYKTTWPFREVLQQKSKPNIKAATFGLRETPIFWKQPRNFDIIVSAPISGVFDLPIIRILTEYKAVIVRIPANNSWIFNLVCKKTVTAPATTPTKKASKRAKYGSTPPTTKTAQVEPPKANEPSHV